MQICNVCRENKEDLCFSKNKSRPNGINGTCRECLKNKHAEKVEKLREQGLEHINKYREHCRAKTRKRLAANRDKINLKKKKYSRTIKGKYLKLKESAKYRKLEMILSLSEYENLITGKKCFYCDNSLPETGHGLDRVDNSLGYRIDNVVPCCTECNLIRTNKISYTEMIEVAKLLKKLRGT